MVVPLGRRVNKAVGTPRADQAAESGAGRASARRAPCSVLRRVLRRGRRPSAVLAGVAGVAGLGATEIGYVLAAAFWPRIVTNLLIPAIADRLGERRRPMILLTAVTLGGLRPVRSGAGLLAAPAAEPAHRRQLGDDPAARRSAGARRGETPRSGLWSDPALGLAHLHARRDRGRGMAGARRPADHPLVDRGHGRLPARRVPAAARGESAARPAAAADFRPPGAQARVPRLRCGRRVGSDQPRRVLRLRHPALAGRRARRAGDRAALGGGRARGSRAVRLRGAAAAPVPAGPACSRSPARSPSSAGRCRR